MDTKKLRQKILDLAIRGKLVPQDPNDEPASVLLERIKEEKERLIKEGKIKKSKRMASSDTPHYENVPFEVPDNWVWITLGDIFTLQAGKNITAKDISEKQDKTHCFPCYGGNGLRGYVSSYNREGRFPLIGRQGALCGNVQYATGKFHATEHAVLVSILKNDNTMWVYYMLKLMDLYRYHTGAAQPGLAVKKLNTIDVIVADINLQNQFATFVHQVNKSKFEVQKSLEKTQLLFDSLMQEYFG